MEARFNGSRSSVAKKLSAQTMRQETGKTSIEAIRRAAKSGSAAPLADV